MFYTGNKNKILQFSQFILNIMYYFVRPLVFSKDKLSNNFFVTLIIFEVNESLFCVVSRLISKGQKNRICILMMVAYEMQINKEGLFKVCEMGCNDTLYYCNTNMVTKTQMGLQQYTLISIYKDFFFNFV